MKRVKAMSKIRKINSLKNNMIIYSLSIILLMTILSIYSISIVIKYKEQMESMFEKHIYLSEVESLVIKMDEDLVGFLTTKSSTKLNDYLINTEKLTTSVTASYVGLQNKEDLLMKNITNLIDAYNQQGKEAIMAKRQRNVVKYDEYYGRSVKIKAFIIDYIGQLNTKQLNINSKAYIQLVKQIRILQTITIVIVLILIGLSIIIAYLITSRMIRPITHLSHAASEIAKGNLETQDVVVESNDELLVLASAFNHMKNSINSYVTELTNKSETETKLKDEQLKNIKMEHLLDNAKLYALQSQINPHFLFNTINAGVQMSIMERATKTGLFLESMSRLFRYNIQKMDSVCSLSEEINNINDYHDLLKARFGDRIQFSFYIDPQTLSIKVPPLILQPLVENAYIHGLSSLEQGGLISITTLLTSDECIITIKDTGTGMSRETIDLILQREFTTEEDKVGIGIRNVRDRLELFYQKKSKFTIESQLGMGVKIIIAIPRSMEV